MRIVRFCAEPWAKPQWGILEGNDIAPISGAPFGKPWRRRNERVPSASARLLAPALPGKIIGVGRNFPAHAAEHKSEVPKEPLLFLKPPSAVIGPGEAIELPGQSRQVEHEGELAVVLGRRCRDVEAEDALQFVFGYTAANDVTARDLQLAGSQWTVAKGFDTFCPLGPWIETDLDPSNVKISCSVNGRVRQSGFSSEMVFSVPVLVAYISSVMTLDPGDVILTGTPAGVGPLSAGDEVEVTVEGVGTLKNSLAQ